MKCANCGSTMRYDIAKGGSVCDYCGAFEAMPKPEETSVDEQDFESALRDANTDWGISKRNVTCDQCGAVMFFDPDQMSSVCPFCGSPIVLSAEEADCGIAPSAMIPFSVSKEDVTKRFYFWNRFAIWSPEKFRSGKVLGNLVGLYVPYWTFDADTSSEFSGEFGYDYEKGDSTYTRWEERSGKLDLSVDDAMVCASKKFLKDQLLNQVIRIDASKLVPYTPDALTGFAAEKYTILIDDAWNMAKQGSIRKKLEYEATKKVNADHRKKIDMNTTYKNIKFKLILVPVWLTACRYKGKSYNVVASGFDNRGNCRRPVSIPKMVLLILIFLGILTLPLWTQLIFLIISAFRMM